MPTRRRYQDPLLDALVERRRELGLSQRDLGELTGMSHNGIGYIERRTNSPSLLNLRTVADALDCDIVLVPRTTVSPDVDAVVVERFVAGERLELTPAERHLVIAEMERRGMSTTAIAGRLGMTARTITRLRAANREQAA